MRRNLFAGAIPGKKLKKRRIAQVFFEIRAMIQIFAINFRNRQAVFAKVFGEGQERGVFFAYAVKDADRACFVVRQPDDLASRAAQFALQRQHAVRRRMKMPFEKFS